MAKRLTSRTRTERTPSSATPGWASASSTAEPTALAQASGGSLAIAPSRRARASRETRMSPPTRNRPAPSSPAPNRADRFFACGLPRRLRGRVGFVRAQRRKARRFERRDIAAGGVGARNRRRQAFLVDVAPRDALERGVRLAQKRRSLLRRERCADRDERFEQRSTCRRVVGESDPRHGPLADRDPIPPEEVRQVPGAGEGAKERTDSSVDDARFVGWHEGARVREREGHMKRTRPHEHRGPPRAAPGHEAVIARGRSPLEGAHDDRRVAQRRHPEGRIPHELCVEGGAREGRRFERAALARTGDPDARRHGCKGV